MPKRPARLSCLVVIVSLVALITAPFGCAIGWDEVDFCGPDEVCESCAKDTDCVVAMSCCGDTMFCYSKHEDDFSICQLGCITPDPPPCRCVDGRCRFR